MQELFLAGDFSLDFCVFELFICFSVSKRRKPNTLVENDLVTGLYSVL